MGGWFRGSGLEPASLPPARWLLIGTLPLAAPGSASALMAAVRQARSQARRLPDMNWRPNFWDATADPGAGPPPAAQAAMQPLLDQAALIKLAREEALWLFNSDDPGAIRQARLNGRMWWSPMERPRCAGTWLMHQVTRLLFSPPASWTRPVPGMLSPPACCTVGMQHPRSGSALQPPVVPWSVAGPVALIRSPRRLRLKRFWGE